METVYQRKLNLKQRASRAVFRNLSPSTFGLFKRLVLFARFRWWWLSYYLPHRMAISKRAPEVRPIAGAGKLAERLAEDVSPEAIAPLTRNIELVYSKQYSTYEFAWAIIAEKEHRNLLVIARGE